MLMIVSVLSLSDWICSEARAKVTENGRLMLAAKLMLVCLAIVNLLQYKSKCSLVSSASSSQWSQM